jgi:hypothetical protein
MKASSYKAVACEPWAGTAMATTMMMSQLVLDELEHKPTIFGGNHGIE